EGRGGGAAGGPGGRGGRERRRGADVRSAVDAGADRADHPVVAGDLSRGAGGGAMEADVDGVRLYWRERGRGEAVLFLHAFPFHGGMGEGQLERLPARWRLIAPALRGFGRSAADAGGGPLTLDRHADDAAAVRRA